MLMVPFDGLTMLSNAEAVSKVETHGDKGKVQQRSAEYKGYHEGQGQII